MADHSLTDLSYGLLGKPKYDTQSQRWGFSTDENLEQRVVQLQPLEECMPSSCRPTDGTGELSSREVQNHLKKLVKCHPDFHSARDIAFRLGKVSIPDKIEDIEGSLLSVGRAVDNGRLTGTHTPLILAMPCGDAGQTLRIVRPSIEKRGWGDSSGASISTFTTKPSDQADFEIGNGSPLRQITFSNEETSSGTWLAVRQDTIIVVFRVVFSIKDERTSFPGRIWNTQPSNMHAQSVVVLPATRSASSAYVDVTFNPLYPRQIAVVDADGRWSIWDIDGRHGYNSSFKLTSGKTGGINDDYVADPDNKIATSSPFHGWHRILWVCNVTTIIVCNRHHLAVFDLQAVPTRLNSTSFHVAKGHDMIVDIKRSPLNRNHVYVLTASKLYWLEISPYSDQKQGASGTKILLSYRHFRNGQDTTMRLATVIDKYVAVLIYSSHDKVLSFYSFTGKSKQHSQPQSAQGSLILSSPREYISGGAWKSAVFFQIPKLYRENRVSQKVAEHLDNVRFIQPWFLTLGHGLLSTLCAIKDTDDKLPITPSTVISRSKRRLGPRYVSESFIVPDSPGKSPMPVRSSQATAAKEKDLYLDWRNVFQNAFLEGNFSSPQAQAPDAASSSSKLLSELSGRIGSGIVENDLMIGTLLELSGFTNLSENIEDVAVNLREFLHSLPEDYDDRYELIVSDLTANGLGLTSSENPRSLELMAFYEQLVDQWMTGLPIDVPNATRAVTFKIIRQVAVELCFSSIAISLRNKAVTPHAPGRADKQAHITDDDMGPTTRDSSPATFYSSRSQLELDHGSGASFPTSTRTSSVYSQSTTGSELTEDPAISRLRQYTGSIKSRPDFEQSRIISEWPAAPGSDPATYLYRAPGIEDSDMESLKMKREKARRRRRTEKFLKNNTESGSPHTMTPLGSQPPEALHPDFSSQPGIDMPMTQPDRGTFGSRSRKGKQRKHKKQRAAGF